MNKKYLDAYEHVKRSNPDVVDDIIRALHTEIYNWDFVIEAYSCNYDNTALCMRFKKWRKKKIDANASKTTKMIVDWFEECNNLQISDIREDMSFTEADIRRALMSRETRCARKMFGIVHEIDRTGR